MSEGAMRVMATTIKHDVIMTSQTTSMIRFNVRGVRYEVQRECLRKAPQTSVLRHLPLESYDSVKDEYYFNRDPYIFNSLLNFLVNGELHFRSCVCHDELAKEMTYWGFEDFHLPQCCWERAENEKSRRQTMELVEREWFGMVLDYEDKAPSEIPWRDRLWLFLEEPASSRGAQAWSLFVLLLVFTSNVELALETVPELREWDDAESEANYTTPGVVTEGRVLYCIHHSHPVFWLVALDITIFTLMTLELLLRFVVTKTKLRFWLTPLNIVDFVALLPMWITLTVFGLKRAPTPASGEYSTFYIIGCTRLLRTFRAIRIMKSFRPMKILLLAWKASKREMVLLIILVTIVAVVFGNLLFFAEIHTDTVKSIPEAIWLGIITLTTIGYGDLFPTSVIGRIIGATCAISGIVVVAMPIPVIVSNFRLYYSCLQSILQARKLRKRHRMSDVKIN